MDKKTILFVLMVGIAFFGLNLFFSHQRDAQNRERLQQQQAQEVKSKLQKESQIQKKTVKVSELPIVAIYSDPEEKNLLTHGITFKGSTLTISWQPHLPQKVYVNGKGENLLSKDSVKEGPVLYASPSFETITIAALPTTGVYDLQLLTFPSNAPPQVYWGEYKEGSLSIPQGPLSENALVLYKTPSQEWHPLGFYEWRGRVLVDLQNIPQLTAFVKSIEQKPTAPTVSSEQKFYVLENDYQQILFSNVGGAIVEINLPFETNKESVSVVKEIGFDREIAKDYSANALFPGHPFSTYDSKEVHTPHKLGGYYPLLRRGVWNSKTIGIPPQYYALNIVSEYPEMAELVYEVKEFTPTKIAFEAVQPHRKITKTFTLASGTSGAPYSFDLDIQIEGDSRGLWLTSGVPEVEMISNNSSPQIQYRLQRKGKHVVEKLDLPKLKEAITVSSIHPDWVVNSNGYLGLIVDPLTETGTGMRATAIAGTQVPTRLSVIDPQHHPYPASKYPGYQVLLPLASTGTPLSFRIYSGPFEESILKTVDGIYSNPETGYNPDYVATWTFYGWFSFISEPFAKLLFIVMKFFHSVTGSWGFSIILLTVFLRVLLYPLNAWSIKSMRRMQQLSPQIQAIQAKHKKDPKKAQMEIMALYREKKVNPFMGCLPILIQLPFLIAMFDLLKSSFQLRGAGFIPGWIDDLTAPDVLFSWNTPIFFIGTQFHLLPILLGAVMFIQQRFFSSTPADLTKMTDQQRQQRAMGTIMTLVFTVMFYHFPSGLNLYWLSSMLLGILQQWMTNRVLDKKKSTEQVLIAPPVKKKLAPKKAK
jgi:YidC/Oxa1 family membrane protein insertase